VDAFRASLQGLVQGGQLSESQKALMNRILTMPRATLVEILQTDDFQTFYANYAATPPQNFQLSAEDQKTVTTTCDVNKLMDPSRTLTETVTEVTVANNTDTAVAAGGSSGSRGPGPMEIVGYIGTTVGLIGAISGALYGGYNLRMTTKDWRITNEAWNKLEGFVKGNKAYTLENAKAFWEKNMPVEGKLNPQLETIRTKMLKPPASKFGMIENVSIEKINSERTSYQAEKASEIKGYKWKAAGGFLAFAVMGALSIVSAVSTFSLASSASGLRILEGQAKALQQAATQAHQWKMTLRDSPPLP
jgi:hypothetical protein